MRPQRPLAPPLPRSAPGTGQLWRGTGQLWEEQQEGAEAPEGQGGPDPSSREVSGAETSSVQREGEGQRNN